MNYLLYVNNVYRVPDINAALKLREHLSASRPGELVAFSYTHKDVKVKGEIVDSYEVCKAKIVFNTEKEPDSPVQEFYEVEF